MTVRRVAGRNRRGIRKVGYLEFFRLGGWPMWFVLLFGVLAVGAAARFALRGEHQLAPFVRWMTLTMLTSSLFGFLTGMMNVLEYVRVRAAPAERQMTLVEGTAEALNVPTFGLLFAVLVCLLLAVGYRRFPSLNPSARAA
jgi:hypothetical protein